MATTGGGLSSQANVAGSNSSAPARARFPGRPWTSRSRLRTEKRPQRGRLGSEDGDTLTGGPRPVDIGQALNEDPSLLRLLGVTEKHRRQRDAGFYSSASEEVRLKTMHRFSNLRYITTGVLKRKRFTHNVFFPLIKYASACKLQCRWAS